MGRMDLLLQLQECGVLKTPLIVDAFKQVDRADFVPEEQRAAAYEDMPLPIGFGQTISQPYTVAFMLEQLQPQPGQNVLDVGTGSGWTTALLSACVGVAGKVYGVERIPELVAFGAHNLKKYHFPQASIHQSAPNALGMPQYAPFDRILVSAQATAVPQDLVKQLKNGGILVVPVGSSIHRIEKASDGNIKTREFPGFAFVPLVEGC